MRNLRGADSFKYLNLKSPEKCRRLSRAWTAWQLRLTGLSFKEIAVQLGLKSHSSAWKLVDRIQKRIETDLPVSVEDWRRQELAKLDRAEFALQKGINEGNPKAIDAMIKIGNRRDRLVGTIKPTETKVSGKVLLVPSVVEIARPAERQEAAPLLEKLIAEEEQAKGTV